MKDKEYLSFLKMIEYINKALKYTEVYTFEQFCDDKKYANTNLVSAYFLKYIVQFYTIK